MANGHVFACLLATLLIAGSSAAFGQIAGTGGMPGMPGMGGPLIPPGGTLPIMTLPVSAVPPVNGVCPPSTVPSNGICCVAGFNKNPGFPSNGQGACIPAPPIPTIGAPYVSKTMPCPPMPTMPGPLLTTCACVMTGANLGGANCPSPIVPGSGPGGNAVSCTNEGFNAIYQAQVANYAQWQKCWAPRCSGGMFMVGAPVPAGC